MVGEKDGKKSGVELAKDLAAPVVGAAAALATVSPTAAAIAAGTGLGALLLRRMLDAVGSHRDRAAATFLETVVVALGEQGTTEDEVAGLLEHRLESDPKAADVVYAALRAILDKPSPAVAVAMGILCAEYLQEDCEPDAFFRGMARVLVDATGSEFVALQGLFGELAAMVADEEGARAHVGISVQAGDRLVLAPGDRHGPTEVDGQTNAVVWDVGDSRRIVDLLRTNLGHDGVKRSLSMWPDEQPQEKTHWDWDRWKGLRRPRDGSERV